MAQITRPMYTSYHQTGIVKFRELFSKKRLDVMSDFTNGVHNGFDDDDMPKDPTEKQMQDFARWKKVTTEEARYMLRGELLGKFALQAIAFGDTPETFKRETTRHDTIYGRVQQEIKTRSYVKDDQKCVNAIYSSVTSYSYFRNDLTDSDMHKCINPLNVMYARPQNKWEKVMLLVMDQAKVTLLPAAQTTLELMTKHQDKQAFDRWRSVLDKDQIQKLMDKYQDYGKNVVNDRGNTLIIMSRLVERPPPEAASPSHRAQAHERSMVTPVDEHESKPTTMLVTGSQHKQLWFNIPRYHMDTSKTWT